MKKKRKKKHITHKNNVRCNNEVHNVIKIYVNGMHYCYVVHTMTYRRQKNIKYLFFFHCYHGFQIEVNKFFTFNFL